MRLRTAMIPVTARARPSGMTSSRAARATGCGTTRRCAKPCASTCRRSSRRAMSSTTAAHRRVPVRMLEHYHFRLRIPEEPQGVGQGNAKPGDVLAEPPGARGQARGRADRTMAACSCCSNSRSTTSSIGCGRRCSCRTSGPRRARGRYRLGARGLGPARRAFPAGSPPFLQGAGQAPRRLGASPTFTDEDLRYRQLARRRAAGRRMPWCSSCWMSPPACRTATGKLAKTFFFWVVQGLRRQYRSLETVFVAHTTEAWEFNEGGLLPGGGQRRHRGLHRA